MLGALLIVLIRQSIRTLHFDQNYEWIVIGCAIIIAVVIDQWSARLAARRLARAAAEDTVMTRHDGRRRWVDGLAPGGSARVGCSRRIAGADRRQRRAPAAAAARAGGKPIKIAMIAKSSTNPVFLAARTGAEAAAKELSAKNGIPIEIDWLTPPQEDGQVQAQRIAQAVNEGADAILISCSDAGKVTGAINDAVDRGVPVMTFDSDAPAVEALRVLRRRRRQDWAGDDGRAGEADGRQGQGRDPRRQPERAEPAQARAGREGRGGEAPRHQDRRHVQPHRDAAGRGGRSRSACNNAYPEIRAGR